MMSQKQVGICLKCGEEGTISEFMGNSRTAPGVKYLRYWHKGNRSCYIGRVRTLEEGLNEMAKPRTNGQYKEALQDIAKDIRELVVYYQQYSGSGVYPALVKRLQYILSKHGL